MKASTFLFATLIWSASSQPLTYCGDKPCLIPLVDLSCEYLILNYKFLGNCCRLVNIPATGGCRVEVGGPGAGNCAWVPFCEPCDPTSGDECGREFRTETDDVCPDLDYDAIAIQKAWDANATEPVEGETPMPTQFMEPVSCAPTASPNANSSPPPQNGGDSSAGASVQVLASVGAAVAGAVLATLF